MTKVNSLETEKEKKTSTIVAFHIGRGGQFYNAGHKSYVGKHTIDFFVNDLFIRYENEGYIFKKINGRTNLEKCFEEFIDSESMKSAAIFEKLGLDFGNKIYTNCSGNPVGLTVDESETGVGCITLDDDYDTTYCIYLHECDDNELKLINDNVLLVEYLEYFNCEKEVIEIAKEFDLLIDLCIDFEEKLESFLNSFDIDEIKEDDYDLYVASEKEINGKFYRKN
jgi:hypothetical protein